MYLREGVSERASERADIVRSKNIASLQESTETLAARANQREMS